MKYIKEYVPLLVVLVCLTKIAISQDPSVANGLLLLVGMGAYAFHSYLEAKSADQYQALSERIGAFETRFQMDVDLLAKNIYDIRAEVTAFKPIQDQVAKSAEDIKKVISTTNLSNSLYQRVRKRETNS